MEYNKMGSAASGRRLFENGNGRTMDGRMESDHKSLRLK